MYIYIYIYGSPHNSIFIIFLKVSFYFSLNLMYNKGIFNKMK